MGQKINNIPDIVIKENIEHYVKADAKSNGREFFPIWNWSAFLFGSLWLIYRRCYKWAILIGLAETIIINILNNLCSPSIGSAVSWLLWIFIGVYGDSIYFKAIKEKIHKLKANGASDMYIIEKTQPSHVPVWISIAIGLGSMVVYFLIMRAIIFSMFFGF